MAAKDQILSEDNSEQVEVRKQKLAKLKATRGGRLSQRLQTDPHSIGNF